jgi:hypothetical protein
MPDVLDPPRTPPPGGPPDTGVPIGPDRSPDEGPAWRCSACNIDWPLLDAPDLVGLPDDFDFILPRDQHRLSCPVCEGPLHFAHNHDAIGVEEARRLKAHADFERYYEATRGREP